MKKTYFKWREVKTFKEVDDDSVISKFYDEEANRLKCSDPAAVTADLETNRSWFSKLPMIPDEVAVKVAKKPTTAWELFRHQCGYKDDKDAVVKAVLEKSKSRLSRRYAKEQTHQGALWNTRYRQ